MSIVSKEELEDELTLYDNQIAKSFGKNPLSNTEKSETSSIFCTSLDKGVVVESVDIVVKNKIEKMNKSIVKVQLSEKDLTEFKEWEDEAKLIQGWEQ